MLESKNVNFKQPKFFIKNRFKESIKSTDNLLYLQLNTEKIKYISCERKDYDIIYNYILDDNDICVCVILEINDIDILNNIVVCKENENNVTKVSENTWIQKDPKGYSIYYKLLSCNGYWLFIKW